MILISNHVHLGIDIEGLDRAAQVGDLFVGVSLRKTTAFDNRRIVLAFRDVIHRQGFNPWASCRQVHPSKHRRPRAGQQIGFCGCRRHLIISQVGRAHSLVKDQLVFLMLPDRPLDIQWRLDLCRRPAVPPALDVMRIVHIEDLLSCRSQLYGKKLPIFRSFEVTVHNGVKFLSCF
jgi:hypothetical protein